MIVALDISTSCTGISIFKDKQHVESYAIVLSKVKGLYNKVDFFIEKLVDIVNKHKTGNEDIRFYVEEPFAIYARGRSSSKTLAVLLQFNGILSYEVYKRWSEPIHINVKVARKALYIKINRKLDTKEQVTAWVIRNVKNFVPVMKKLKSGPRKGMIITDSITYDMADALVIGLAGIKIYETNTQTNTQINK